MSKDSLLSAMRVSKAELAGPTKPLLLKSSLPASWIPGFLFHLSESFLTHTACPYVSQQ